MSDKDKINRGLIRMIGKENYASKQLVGKLYYWEMDQSGYFIIKKNQSLITAWD